MAVISDIDNGKLVRRAVTLGLKTDDASFVEVREGLAVGTSVLAAKIDALQDGAAVTLAKPSASPAQ